MRDDPIPRRQRVTLHQRRLSPAEVRARELAEQLYAELPWWRRLITRRPKGGR